MGSASTTAIAEHYSDAEQHAALYQSRYPESMSFWTRNPPTDEGYYWAIKNEPSMRPVIVELGRSYANGPLEIRDFLRESVDFPDSDICEVIWWGPQIERPATPPPPQ